MAKNKVKFEDSLARLEKVVEELESGNLTLDQSLASYEDGVKALKKCYEILRDAEKRVEILLQDEKGELKTAPYESEADGSSEAEASAEDAPSESESESAT